MNKIDVPKDAAILLQIVRHYDKAVPLNDKGEKLKFIPGGTKDQMLELSEDGKLAASMATSRNGKHPIPEGLEYIFAGDSGFVRAWQTNENGLWGAGYSIFDPIVHVEHDPEVGLAGADWTNKEALDVWSAYSGKEKIAQMMVQFYEQRESKKGTLLPSMKRSAEGVIAQTHWGITSAIKSGKEKSLVRIATHAPTIDAAAVTLYGSLFVGDGQVVVGEQPNDFGMGDMITGFVGKNQLQEKNPIVNFNIDGKGVSYTMDRLFEMAGTPYI